MTRKWFVTGAAGFIGSNLCEYLLRKGEMVIGYDNYETGSQENVARLSTAGEGRFSMREGDIRSGASLEKALDDADVVVHLAAQVSVPRSFDDPIHTNSVNVDGFLAVLTASLARGIGNFVYASSCAVYGDTAELPLHEGMTPKPMSPYAATKIINEHYASTLSARFRETSSVGLRFFNVYGPWQTAEGGYASVIPRWVGLLMGNSQPQLFGDGTATRDFCYVEDVCRAIEAAATPSVPPGIYNVGSGTSLDMMSLYREIVSSFRKAGRATAFDSPAFVDARHGDILHSLASTEMAESALGFKTNVTLTDGIDRLIARQYA